MLTVEWCYEKGYLDIIVTMSFTIRNFQNTNNKRVNLVSKCFKIDVDFRN